jgi:hypothetical protein
VSDSSDGSYGDVGCDDVLLLVMMMLLLVLMQLRDSSGASPDVSAFLALSQ